MWIGYIHTHTYIYIYIYINTNTYILYKYSQEGMPYATPTASVIASDKRLPTTQHHIGIRRELHHTPRDRCRGCHVPPDTQLVCCSVLQCVTVCCSVLR